VGDRGITAVVDGLSMRGIIQDLYLHGLDMKQEGCEAVIRALPSMPELRKCILGRVSLSAKRQLEWVQEEMRCVLRRQDLFVASWPVDARREYTAARRPSHPTEVRRARTRKSQLSRMSYAGGGSRADSHFAGNQDPLDPVAGIVVYH